MMRDTQKVNILVSHCYVCIHSTHVLTNLIRTLLYFTEGLFVMSVNVIISIYFLDSISVGHFFCLKHTPGLILWYCLVSVNFDTVANT